MTTGIGLIESERMRQVLQEGWTAEHDAQHDRGEMAHAAGAYAIHASKQVQGLKGDGLQDGTPPIWPWNDSDWKPSADPIRNLTKAGALIAAEIDRLLRLQGS